MPCFPERNPIRQYLLVPITVIRGFKDGATLVQTAGCHRIDATKKLWNSIKHEELAGSFTGVPCLNVPGSSQRTYITPLDGRNIQERYPGTTDGTISDLTAYVLFNDVALKSDYYLGCHGGDVHESELWTFIYHKTSGAVEKIVGDSQGNWDNVSSQIGISRTGV
jgi:predicted deacylase